MEAPKINDGTTKAGDWQNYERVLLPPIRDLHKLDVYEQNVVRANEIIAAAELDATVEANDREYSLRWILAHMIDETARHAGHMDIIREQLDGATGYLPPM